MTTRRRVLAGTGVALAAGAASGLESFRSEDTADASGGIGVRTLSERELDEGRTPSEVALVEEFSLAWLERDWEVNAEDATPAEIVRVGAGDGRHRVVVFADADRPREILVAIRPAGGSPIYAATLPLSRSSYLGAKFERSERFLIELGVGFRRAGVAIRESSIDCNRSIQGVLLRADGRTEERTVSTLIGC